MSYYATPNVPSVKHPAYLGACLHAILQECGLPLITPILIHMCVWAALPSFARKQIRTEVSDSRDEEMLLSSPSCQLLIAKGP